VTSAPHSYEIRPRKDKRGVDLISDALPFGHLWYAEPNAISSNFLEWHLAVTIKSIPTSSRRPG